MRRALTVAVWTVLAVAWVLVLRPAALGGPATYVLVSGGSMDGTLATGDLVIVTERRSYGSGDIVTFDAPGSGAQVIHRITAVTPDGYVTKGDNNPQPDGWRVDPRSVKGRLLVRLPFVGSIVQALASRVGVALTAGALAAWVMLGKRSRPTEADGALVPDDVAFLPAPARPSVKTVALVGTAAVVALLAAADERASGRHRA